MANRHISNKNRNSVKLTMTLPIYLDSLSPMIGLALIFNGMNELSSDFPDGIFPLEEKWMVQWMVLWMVLIWT
jgi:hypothetical protein